MSDARILDDRAAWMAADPFGMMGLTYDLPSQVSEAIQIGEAWDAPALSVKPNAVLVTGMGGSAIGGDLLRCLFEDVGSLPLAVNRDYRIPKFVGRETLVIAASYSGNTEETLSAYRQAKEAGAQIIVLSSGGELTERAKADGFPYITVPAGLPPRAALGYLFFPLVVACEKLGLLPDLSRDRTLALEGLRKRRDAWGPDKALDDNPAKVLAIKLAGRTPIVYGVAGYPTVAALRWKGQINENAKMHAFAYSLPEMNHNEILGWVTGWQQADNWSVMVLRDGAESAKMAKRIEVTKECVGRPEHWHELTATGGCMLDRMMSLTYFGDFVSVYLAFLNGQDPTNIDYINHLKSELAKVGD